MQRLAGETQAVKKKGWLACKSMDFLLPEVSPFATNRHASQTAARGKPQPPRRKRVAKRNDEGRQGWTLPERIYVLINLPEPSAEAVQIISGWLAGRWRTMEGTTVDVFAARIFLFRAAIQTQSSGVKAKEATASCVTNYGACGVPEGQSSYYIYFLINDCSCCFGLAHLLAD